MGYFFYKPNKKFNFRNEDTVQLRFNNDVLYTKDYYKILAQIISDLQLKFSHYYRVDIAIDGADIYTQANKLFGNRKLSQVKSVRPNGRLIQSTQEHSRFRFGSARKGVSMYDKTEVLKKKPYIEEFWKLNSIPVDEKEIYRLELRMKSQHLKDFSHDLKDFENPDYLATYYKSKVGTWLTFYHVNNMKRRKSIIDWNEFTILELVKPDSIIPPPSLHRIKQALKLLVLQMLGTFHGNLNDVILNIADEYNLRVWLKDRIENKWKETIARNQLQYIRDAKARQMLEKKKYLDSLKKKS